MRKIGSERDGAARYSDEVFALEDPLLQRIRAAGEALRPGMMVSAHEGKMLHLFAKMVGARRVLEIGTFVGYSTVWLARALPEDGQVISIEFDAHHARLAREMIAEDALVASKITILEGKALEELDKLRQRESLFDVVFIDAAKAEYAQYLALCVPMLREGGLIIGDNTLLFGAMAGEPWQKTSRAAEESMRAFNAALAGDPCFTSVLIPTHEGLTVAMKNSSK